MSVYNGNGMKPVGRSSSQRSIYDYPEHLNPFYEDENHKRLRFWKIGSDDKKSGRSSSFSIDGLRGLWSFKSFKLKKKSSTLGINKTSESPPMLRRDGDGGDEYGSQTTLNSHVRHSEIGLSNNFERGAGYRCSLQDLNSNGRPGDQVFFVRNHRYRNTVQPGNPTTSRYQSNATIGPITPTLRSKFMQSNLSRGSSQMSVNSGNPFEDEDYETISQVGSPERTSIRRSGRKKRRAPQPPGSPAQSPNKATIATVVETNGEGSDETVNITNLTAEIESFVRTADTDREKIESTNNVHEEDEARTPQNKTNNIGNENENENENELKTSRQSPESNEYYPQDEQVEVVTLEKIQNLGSMDVDVSNNSERCKKSPVKILIRAPTDEDPVQEHTEASRSVDEMENIHEAKDTERETIIVQQERIVSPTETRAEGPEVESKPENANVDIQNSEAVSSNVEAVELKKDDMRLDLVEEIPPAVKDLDEALNTTPTSSAVEFTLENIQNDQDSQIVTNLRITESTDDLSTNAPTQSSEVIQVKKSNSDADADADEEVQLRPKLVTVTTHTVAKENITPTSAESKSNLLKNFEIRTVPLKNDSPMAPKKNNSGNSQNEPPTPPQRRKSVKEIIESINKCQSLLKINQNQKKDKTEKEKINSNLMQASSSSTTSKLFNSRKSFNDRNMNDLTGKRYQDKKMFSDVAEVNNNGIGHAYGHGHESNTNGLTNIPLFVEKFDELNNNTDGIVFEKCLIRGDKKQNEIKVSNVEWNPVPKPRRHRHSQQGSIN